MNKRKVIIGVLMAAIFVMVAFVPVAELHSNQLNSAKAMEISNANKNNTQYNIQGSLISMAESFNLKQISLSSKTLMVDHKSISIDFSKYSGINKNMYAISTTIYINGHIYSSLFTLINVRNSNTEATIYPLLSTILSSPYHFNIDQAMNAHTNPLSRNPDGFSHGWLGIAILFNQQQTIELATDLGAGAAIAGFVATVAGLTGVGLFATLIAAAVTLLLALGAFYILNMDAAGNFQGINIDVTWGGLGSIHAPEHNVPWGY